MKRLFYIMNLIMLPLSAFWQAASAQQVTDLTQQAQAQAATAPQAVGGIPAVSAAVTAPAAKSPFDFSGYFKLQPIGYDDEDSYIGLNPGASLATKFNAMGDKLMSISLTYDLGYRAFYTSDAHTADDMDFDNNFTVDSSLEIFDKLSVSAHAFADITNQANDASGNAMWFEGDPKVTYKATPTTSLSVGYGFAYIVYTENILKPGAIDAGGPPSEPGDIVPFSAGSATSSDAFGAFAFSPAAAAPGPEFSNEKYLYWHEVNAGVSQKFSPATSGTLGYVFGRYISNDDNSETYGNKLKAGIKQTAWQGATLSANYELRVYDFIYAMADDASTPKRTYRNRLTFELAQELNKWFSIEAHYRYQKTYSNFAAAELDPSQRHQLWVGIGVAF